MERIMRPLLSLAPLLLFLCAMAGESGERSAVFDKETSMTVQTSTNVASFNGDGINKTFPIGYKFNSEADLVVTLIDDKAKTTQILTLNSDFTVTGAGDEGGGAVILTTAPTSVQRVKVTRIVDVLQLTDLRNQGKFYAEIHEDALDLLTMIAQQQQTEIGEATKASMSAVETAESVESRYNQFEQGATFYVLGDYAAGLLVGGYNQVFRKDGELYRASARLDLPYTLTGDWSAEGPDFVSVGDGVLRQQLRDADYGASLVGRSIVVYQNMADLQAVPSSRLKTDQLYRVTNVGNFIWNGSSLERLFERQGWGSLHASLPSQRYTSAQIAAEISYAPARLLFARQASELQYAEVIFPVSSGQDAVVEFDIDTTASAIGITSASQIHAAAVGCQNADRGSPAGISAITVSVDGSRVRVTVPSANVTSPYLAVSLRMNASTDASLAIKSIVARQGPKILGRDLFNLFPRFSSWAAKAATVKLPSRLGDIASRVQLSDGTAEGAFTGPSRVDVAPDGGGDVLFPPYSLDFYADRIHGKGYANKVALSAGDYYLPRKQFALNVTEDVTLVAVGGQARILGGKELSTSTWTKHTESSVIYYSAPYDWATNYDTDIRA